MAKKPRLTLAEEKRILKLLGDYACPVPYHEVRARFMGNIASPDMTASPVPMIRDLWGGELPEFEAEADINDFFGVLIQGLWNDLARHQKRTDPFRLSRVKADTSLDHLAKFARRRRQELDGFVEGLFNGQDEIDLPEKGHVALGVLAEVRATFAGVLDMSSNDIKPVDASQLQKTFKHLRELSRIAEHEINTIIQSCTRARRQMLETFAAEKPVLH
jgi:hypothetical protein